jgi:hypothetical protein
VPIHTQRLEGFPKFENPMTPVLAAAQWVLPAPPSTPSPKKYLRSVLSV